MYSFFFYNLLQPLHSFASCACKMRPESQSSDVTRSSALGDQKHMEKNCE